MSAVDDLTRTGRDLYYALPERVLDTDADNDYAMAKLCAARAAMWDDLVDLVMDDETTGAQGWAKLLDPFACPADCLPWLAVWEGVEIPPGLAEAEVRSLIDEAPAQKRGTPWSMEAVARRYTTGTKTVYTVERVGGDPSLMRIATLSSETPDPALMFEAVVKYQKPAGIKLLVVQIAGGDFATLRDAHTDFADVAAQFATFEDARADPSLT